jgi:regulator of replication initiation timing
MTDYSWLEPIQRETERIKKETEHIREENKRLREALSNGELINSEESQKNYYNYRVIDYCASGEGRTIFLQIYRNDSNDYYQKRWRQFVGQEFYLPGTEELSEREFLDKYSRFLPNVVAHKLRDRSLTIWETQVHFNYG